MAKLIIGTNKQTVVPAIVRDKSPEIYRVFRVNNGKIENSISTPFMPLPSTATDIESYCYFGAYKNTPASVLSGIIDLSSLTTLSGVSACNYMFYNCDGITSVDLSGLTTVSGDSACLNMFYNCDGITSVDLSGLTTISGQSACYSMFRNCDGITSVDLSGLTTISGQSACYSMFGYCTGLTSVDLSGLTSLTGFNCCSSMFERCQSLTSLSFPALTSNSFGVYKNQFTNLISGVTGCTIHLPSNLDPQSGSTVISSLTGYPNFGGTNTTVLFDLPATE